MERKNLNKLDENEMNREEATLLGIEIVVYAG
mgnify:CR=1 FL=1